jgi:surface carbohydrate biosynthesis protein
MFIKPKKVWRQPKKIQVLVYDRMGSENFVPYLKNYDYSIFDVRGESINITCLFRCLFKVSFWSKSAFECYIETYISLASPKALITFTDNDFRFWKISKKSLGVKTFFVQNGLRGTMGDVFGFIQTSEDYRVDYMFVFGEVILKKFAAISPVS